MSNFGPSFKTSITEFHKARQKAAVQRIMGRLTGRSVELLSFDEVASKLRVTNRVNRGLQTIPVDAIVGSVGRYTDFTRTFLPRLASDSQRWASVKSAAVHVGELPPIDVYQIGEAYFVLDGNHRVSIARQQGVNFIEAQVTEVRTKVPLSPDDSPDELILKAEYAAFLERTQLDRLRPDSELELSAPGKYLSLENHIEVHRYFEEVEQGSELRDEEAVCLWHDEAYLPVIEAIREQGIMIYFPTRTETDFYIWLATHQRTLQNELGWLTTPGAAVAKLASQFNPEERSVANFGRKILDIVVPGQLMGKRQEPTWSQTKALARYAGSLFQDILVVVKGSNGDGPEVAQAIHLARREEALLHGVNFSSLTAGADGPGERATGERFQQRCVQEGVSAEWVSESGNPLETIAKRSSLADLVVLSKGYWSDQATSRELETGVGEVVSISSCPILIVPDEFRPLRRMLLAYDDTAKAREALFVATYLAECWQVSLAIATIMESKGDGQEATAYARRYLEMHEVNGTFVSAHGQPGDTLLQMAADHDVDMVIMGSHGDGRMGGRAVGRTLWQVLQQSVRPLMICP
jgi:nucleotide-binding universal stress UspA family protein/uncharacterized ParB-like nuclease family protein